MINHWFIDLGYVNPPSIIAGGPVGGDCHDLGHGPLRTGEPVIVDIFPRNGETLYYGDCTRTVVHGDVPDEVAPHARGGVRGQSAGMAAARAGVTGEDVHRATIAEIERHGYKTGLPPADAARQLLRHDARHRSRRRPGMPRAAALGLQRPGAVRRRTRHHRTGPLSPRPRRRRVEDIVLIHADRCETLNRLPEGWIGGRRSSATTSLARCLAMPMRCDSCRW